MDPVCVVIIGMGPRGLSVLERIVENLCTARNKKPFTICIVEPGECGQGVHFSMQPSHLLTNTVASQVSIFAPYSVAGGRDGVSFTQWAKLAGYRKYNDTFQIRNAIDGCDIDDNDYLPRSMLGEYLSWAYHRIVNLLPDYVNIQHYKSRAVDMQLIAENRFSVKLESGYEIEGDFVFMTTGHAVRKRSNQDKIFEIFANKFIHINEDLKYIRNPYPVTNLDKISPSAIIAIQGLGLTSYDIVSQLTKGRGGLFYRENGQMKYQPSGKEPKKILIFSRTCLPFAARGINQKGINGRHQAEFFTVDAIKTLQRQAVRRTGSLKLNFTTEVLPLIKKEMAYAFRLAQLGREFDISTFEINEIENYEIENLLDPLTLRNFVSFEEFRSFFWNAVKSDLAEAEKGNLSSPIKAACDVLRDTREALRYAIEFCGLTPETHKTYVEQFVNSTNRISFGPPRVRNEELIALNDAGLLEIAGGPGNKIFLEEKSGKFVICNTFDSQGTKFYSDVLVSARLDLYSPTTDSSKLTNNLFRRGIIRPHLNDYYHPSGIDINEDMNVINHDGVPYDNLWAIGFLVEGPHFYTHALPRPLIKSRFTQDADRCVRHMFASPWFSRTRRQNKTQSVAEEDNLIA